MLREEKYYQILDVNYCMFKSYCPKFQSEECTYKCKRMDGMNYLLSLSNLPRKFMRPQRLNPDLIKDKKTYKFLETFINEPEAFVNGGYSAYFYGNTGKGKTCWAVRCLTTYFDSVSEKCGHTVKGLYINVPNFLVDTKFHLTHDSILFRELCKDIENAKLVVWDDIFQTDPSTFESQCLYSYINARIDNELANIYTSNMEPDTVRLHDQRLYSRICRMGDCLQFDCEDDLRGTYFSEDFCN